MKGLVSVLSSVFVGLMLAATNFAPLIGLHRFMENRRRVFNAVLFAVSGFVLVMAAMLLTTIDLVVQYEDQGLFFWNAILTIASILGAAAVICFVAAKSCLPSASDYVVFDGSNLVDKLQSYFQNMTESHARAQAAPGPSPNSEMAEEVAFSPPQEAMPERPSYAH